MRNEDNLESSTNQNMRFFEEWSKYYGKTSKIEECQLISLMNVQNIIFDIPLSTWGI